MVCDVRMGLYGYTVIKLEVYILYMTRRRRCPPPSAAFAPTPYYTVYIRSFSSEYEVKFPRHFVEVNLVSKSLSYYYEFGTQTS